MTIKLLAPGSIQLPHWGTLLFMGQCGVYEHLMMIMLIMASEHLLEFLVGIVDDKLLKAVRLERLETVQV